VKGHGRRVAAALRRVAGAMLAAAAIVLFCSVRWIHADTGVQTIVVHARRYEFSPAEITMKKGDTVKLVFIADDVDHGIAIDDLGLNVDLMKHKPQTISITPSKVGDFDGECSRYCGTGHSDMTFVVHVNP
jgi:cytochrome c oxidase subunit II